VVHEPAADLCVDPQTEWLEDVLGCLAKGVAACGSRGNAGDVPDAVRIDRIARLEKIKAAAAALQAAESVRFGQSQAEAQLAADVHPDRIGRGIADQLGLACKVSGFEAARRLRIARALWFDLPETYRLMVVGDISEYVASLVVTETRHLDANTRRDVDAKITVAGISRMGPRSAAACARRYAYEADPHGYVQRGRKEPSGNAAAGAGHDEPAVGVSACRAGCRLSKGIAGPDRRGEGRRRSAVSGSDHRTMTGSPLRRLQELAAQATRLVISGWRATKEANLAGCLSECNQHG
jgi:hypothetical protein